MAKIYLDAGHGGSDSGATHNGRRESDDCLKMCLAVGALLTEQHVEVKYARTSDIDKLLNDRTSEANNWGADYYLSIHRNSFDGSASGDEIWIIHSATEKTYADARTILKAVCAADGLPNRGVKEGAPSYEEFAVNRNTVAPSALLEMGFITADKDNAALDKNFSSIAVAIAKALCAITGVPYKDGETTKPITSADARSALRIAAKIDQLTQTDLERLDTDGDGKITSKDARSLLRKAAKIDS